MTTQARNESGHKGTVPKKTIKKSASLGIMLWQPSCVGISVFYVDTSVLPGVIPTLAAML